MIIPNWRTKTMAFFNRNLLKLQNTPNVQVAYKDMVTQITSDYRHWASNPSQPYYIFTMTHIKAKVPSVASLNRGEIRCLGILLASFASKYPNHIVALGPNSANHQQYTFI